MQQWMVKITYRSEEHGTLECEFTVKSLEQIQTLLHNGPGVASLQGINLTPPGLDLEEEALETVESLDRQAQARAREGENEGL